MGKTTETHINWLKPEQVETLRDAVHDGRYGLRGEAILVLLNDTGLRRDELKKVNRDMLDFDEEQLWIPGSSQNEHPTDQSPGPVTFELDRSGQLRTVRTIRAYLGTRSDSSPALFPPQKSERPGGKAINEVVKRASRAAGVRPYNYSGRGSPEDVTDHTFWHSVAWGILRAEEGNTLYDVRNRLRHQSILTTERNYDYFQSV